MAPVSPDRWLSTTGRMALADWSIHVEDTAKFIQSHAEDKLRNKDTSFQAEKEKRRSKFY